MLGAVKEKVRSGHANFSFFCGLLGGILASVSALGHTIQFFARIGPWWMPLIWFVVLLAVCIGDWASVNNPEPNRPAVVTAILFPSCATAALTGAQGAKVFESVKALGRWFGPSWVQRGADWQHAVNAFLSPTGGALNGFTAFSVVFVGIAAVYAQRYAAVRKAAKASGAGAAAGTGTTPGRRFGAKV